MSSELTKTDSMMFVGELPWHGLGNPIPNGTVLSAAEAIVASELNWDVYQRPVYIDGFNGKTLLDGKANCRRILADGVDTEEVLGYVGPRYTVVQNVDAFEWFTPFVESKQAYFHTAGSLKGGKIVWVLAELNREPIEIRKNDFVRKFLLLSHSHDGSRALRIGFTPVRVVCWNTLSMATGKGDQTKMLRFKHTQNVMENLKAVRETVNTCNASFEATAEQFKALTKRAICKSDLEKYVTIVLSAGSPSADVNNPSTKMKNSIDTLVAKIASGDVMGGSDGTIWDAYNGITEHLTWNRGADADSRLTDLWLGGMGGRMNDVALTTAVKLLAV